MTVIFDNAVGRLRDEKGKKRFEILVSEAATAAVEHLKEGWEVALLTRDEWRTFGSGPRHRMAILEILAETASHPAIIGTLRGEGGGGRWYSGGSINARPGVYWFMKFPREKRFLLGILGLIVPFPLPLNEVLEWPVFGAYLGAVSIVIWRNSRGAEKWLPVWSLNVLGLIYLPILWMDITSFGAGGMLKPVLHLALYVTVVKLASFHRDVERWHIFGCCFFIFLAAMGTSVHPTIVLYLGVYVAASILVMADFAQFSVLAGFKMDEGKERPSLITFSALGALVALGFAGVIFPLIPRIDSPFFLPSGSGTGAIIHAAGFSDSVSLDAIGFSRQDRTAALRLKIENRVLDPAGLRLKAATYEIYNGRSWSRSNRIDGWSGICNFMECISLKDSARPAPKSRVHATMFLQPLGARSVPLPVQFLSFESNRLPREMQGFWADRGGGIMLLRMPKRRIEFSFDFDPNSYRNIREPVGEELEAVLDPTGATPRIETLAQVAMGHGGVAEQIRNLETYLMTEYSYTEEFLGRTGEYPLEEFLFDTKKGHCEFFASSMVVMLRSQGIPARLVTGFLGGEYSGIQNYFVVRQSNAHAWVEAWTPEVGWEIFDPTPPSGLPSNNTSQWSKLKEILDNLGFFWDSWVLTYGVEDQVSVFSKLGGFLKGFLDWIPGSAEEGDLVLSEDSIVDSGSESTELESPGWFSRIGPFLLVLFGSIISIFFYWKSLPPRSAQAAYRSLLKTSSRAGLSTSESTSPMEFRADLEDDYPQSLPVVDRVIEFYLRESFNDEVLSREDRETIQSNLVEANTLIKKKKRA